MRNAGSAARAGGRAPIPVRRPHCAAVVLLACFAVGCGRTGPPAAVLTPLTFDARGITLSISPSLDVHRVDVLDGGGRLEATLPWPGGETARVAFPYRWRPGDSYTVRVRDATGFAVARMDRAPAAPEDPLELRFEVPHGAGGDAETASIRALAAGARAEGTVTVVSRRSRPLDVELVLEHGGLFEGGGIFAWEAAVDRGPGVVRARVRLEGLDDIAFGQVALRLPAGAAGDPVRVVLTARAAGEPGERRLERLLVPKEPADLARQVELLDFAAPVTVAGDVDPRWQPDAVHLPGSVGADLLRVLGVRPAVADPYEPYTWAAVSVRNRSDTPVPLLLRMRVADAGTGAPIAALSAPAHASGGSGESLQMADCPPGRVTRVTLPLFVNAMAVEEGVYRREVSAVVLGTDQRVFDAVRPLEIRRTGALAWAAVLGSLAVALAGALVLALAGNRFWQSFRLRELVTIALYGSVSFAAVTLPGSLLASVLSAVLGPASAVVTGLVGRVLGYMVLVSLLVLVPRVGAATLAVAVRWALSAVLFGQFGVTGLLYLATYAVLLESALVLAGVTHRGPTPSGGAASPQPGRARALVAAVLVGLADAASTFVDFQITVLLYRVFFADWYVWITVFLNGFVYTAAGTLLGFRFGRELARVA